MSFKKSNLFLGINLTLIAYLFFASSSAFVKLLPNIPTIEIVFFQTFIPLICLIPFFFTNGFNLKTKSFGTHLIRDISGIASYFCYFLAIKHISLIDATVLTYTAPFFIPIIWSIWMKEQVQKSIWWAISLGFIGILFILKPGTEIFHIGSIIGILAGIISAIALTSIGILNVKKEHLTTTLFYYFFIGSICLIPFLIPYWVSPSLLSLLILIGVGVTNFFGQMLLTKAFTYGTASFLSPLSYSIVIYTAIISWILFKAPPGWLSFVGITIIIFGGTLTFILKREPVNISEVFEKNQKKWWQKWKK